jgi:hypothetical protein
MRLHVALEQRTDEPKWTRPVRLNLVDLRFLKGFEKSWTWAAGKAP